jgi:hypothetical protein
VRPHPPPLASATASASASRTQALESLRVSLSNFASEGLRTLVVTQREVSPALAQEWLQQFNTAQTSVGDRDAHLGAAAEAIESDLTCLGATAIEDRLQVGGQCVCVWGGGGERSLCTLSFPAPGAATRCCAWATGVLFHPETGAAWWCMPRRTAAMQPTYAALPPPSPPCFRRTGRGPGLH